ncbi:MAG: hypothetical protein U0804_14910 [Gemmataceae bacterium]
MLAPAGADHAKLNAVARFVEGKVGTRMNEFTDGTSNTFAVV